MRCRDYRLTVRLPTGIFLEYMHLIKKAIHVGTSDFGFISKTFKILPITVLVLKYYVDKNKLYHSLERSQKI